jgi:SAM-dependent methyltransferase
MTYKCRMPDRWTTADVPRGRDYDVRFDRLAASGVHVHGEADLVEAVGAEHGIRAGRLLDAGCGTGRVAIELARRGWSTVGVDVDPAMLAAAREKAPGLAWVLGDLADSHLDVGGGFDVAVLAGNVMIFVAPGSEPDVVGNLARRLRPGGLLVAGFSVRAGGLGGDAFDGHAATAGLEPAGAWSTWDRTPAAPGDTYAVRAHLLPAGRAIPGVSRPAGR